MADENKKSEPPKQYHQEHSHSHHRGNHGGGNRHHQNQQQRRNFDQKRLGDAEADILKKNYKHQSTFDEYDELGPEKVILICACVSLVWYYAIRIYKGEEEATEEV